MANKKFLVIFDLNETLLFLRKDKRAILTGTQHLYEDVKFDDKVSPYHVRYRGGRPYFLESMFTVNHKDFDVAVWSSLNPQDTQILTSNFFGRYYRNLLFVAPTKREEYEGKQGRENFAPIPIQRDLGQIFQKFPQYEQSNTIVFTTQKNLLAKYALNDAIIPRYNPQVLGAKFMTDPGLSAIVKYLTGMRVFMKRQNMDDARVVLNVKSILKTFEKVEHNDFAPRQMM